MAGQPKTKAQIDTLTDQRDKALADCERLRRIMAINAPHLIPLANNNEDKALGAEPFGQVTEKNADDLCQRITAMGEQGMMESEMIAALSMTRKQWDEARLGFPTVSEAASRARVKTMAYFESRLRRAIEDKDTKFPVHAVRETLRALAERDSASSEGSGDAVSLVKVAS